MLNPQEDEILEGDVTVSDGATSGNYRLTQEADAMITDWREESDYAQMLLHFSEEVTTTTTFHDSSGNTPPRDGRCRSGRCPTTIGGPFGNALEFDGTDNYVDASKVVTHVSGSDVSFSYGGWVYPSSALSQLGAVFVFTTQNGKSRSEVYYRPDNKFQYCSGTCIMGANTFGRDQWHHVMVTINKETGTGYLYVNGVKETSFGAVSLATDDRFEIGRKLYQYGYGQPFKGRIDEVVVFDKALKPREVQELYGKPVFDMPLDENSGATIFEDQSGFDNDATCPPGGCPTAGVAGVADTAVRFDGQDYLPVPDSSALNLSDGDFTVSTWIAPEGDTSASSCPWRAEYYYYEYDKFDSYYDQDPFDEQPPFVTRCDPWPDYDWGTGKSPSGHSDNFGVRWTGTFEFKGGSYTFHVVTDDGFQLYVGGTQIARRWSEGSYDLTYTHPLGSGFHTIRFEYFEKAGSARAKLEISPDPLPHTQGILGAADYPAVQRVENRLRITLNTPDGKKKYTTSNDVLTPGAWNHVVVTFDGSTLTVYLDGVSVQEFAVSGVASDHAFDIGRSTDQGDIEIERLDNKRSNFNELRIYYQEEGKDWEEVWSKTGLLQWESYAVNEQRTFKNGANVRVKGYDWQYSTILTGTVTVRAMDPSDYQAADTFGPGGYKGVNLLWYETTDSVPFRGRIDEVAIYKRVLSADEVTALYQADSMALHLPLDDPPGSTTFEDAARQSNGACTGDHCPTAGVPGRDNMALLFDGQNDYVEVELDVSETVYALALWFKTTCANCGIFSVDDGSLGSDGHDRHVYLNNGNLYAHVSNDETIYTSGANYADGNWHHVAHTFGGAVGGQKLYVDGVQRASGAKDSSSFDGQTGVNVGFSNNAGDQYFDGLLDDVRLYKRALDADEVQELYQAAPQMLLLLDEDVGATQFEDATGNGHHGDCSGSNCPDAGAKGQLGLAAQFDGDNDYIEVPDSGGLMPDQELTLAAWVNMTASEVDQIIVGKSTGSDGYVLGAQDGELYPQVWDSSGALYSGQWGGITPGYWTHVAMTWKTDGDLIGYVNGNEVGRIPASSNPIGANTNPLRVGIAPWSTSQYPANGFIDHVTLYSRALWPAEVRQLYRFQAKWIEERQSTEITIDADAPTSILESDQTYRPNRDAVQLVTTDDPTSYVTMVEMGVSTNDGLSYTWETAPACEDAPSQGAAWCPTFDPTQGEGRYLVQTRATDVLGNVETPSQTYTLLVDGTPPNVGTTMQEGEIVGLVPHPEVENTWLAPLHGTANDPPLSSGDPGSGVASVEVRLFGTTKLTDTLPMSATLNGANWEANYEISLADPTGTYTVEAQATDNVGNVSDIVPLVTIGIDASPPEASLDPVPTPFTDTITTTLTFSGLVTETGVISTGIALVQIGFLPGAQAAMSRTVTLLHLNELPGAAIFHNRANPGNPATCQSASCPTAGADGKWGNAVSFDGGDHLVVNDVGQRLTSGALSFGAWVYPEESGTILVFKQDLDDHDTFVLLRVGWVSGDCCYVHYADGQAEATSADTVDYGRWYHVMVVIDQDGNGTLYVDGKVETTFQTSVRPPADAQLSIGDDHLNARVDEVIVYDGAFTAAEVYASYADATLAASGEGVLDTTWSYTGPEELDGLYQINLYAEDVMNNGNKPPGWNTGWRGQIDTRAPRVAVTAEETGMYDEGVPSFNTKTTYTCWAQDFNLYVRTSPDDDTSTEYDFQCPCQRIAPHATVYTSTFYHEVSPWYAATFTSTTRLYEYQATCTVPGPALASSDMRACDIYGRCTEAIAAPSQVLIVAPIDSGVLTPTHNTILTSTSPVSITGYAYARDRLQKVEVKVDNVVITTLNWLFTPAVTNTQWSSLWLAPTEGTHTLLSVATDHNNQEQAFDLYHPVDVIVDSIQPYVDISPVVLTTTHRLGPGRVALTGQATDATSGMDHVEVQIDGGDWAPASYYSDQWRYEWYLGEDVAGETYTVTARATDLAGHTSRVTSTVTVDLEVPNPITLTLTSSGQVIPRGTTIYTVPTTLDLSWVTSTARTDLVYEVIWSVYDPQRTDYQIPPGPIPHSGPFESQYIAGEGQRIEPSVISKLTDGNQQRDVYGSVYVDSPLTPDYVTLQPAMGEIHPYQGWMDSGCSLVGTDRRIEGHAQSTAALAQNQELYVTWDSEALRIAWTGANWDYDGDLFIYLNTLGEGAAAAYNPYTQTKETTINLAGAVLDDAMGGFEYAIWVEDAQTATFIYWDVNYWDVSTPLLTRQNYQFHEGLNGGQTDLYIPFDWIGVDNPALSPLMLTAFATEDDAMRLWGAMPPANPVNSDLVVDTGIFAGDDHNFGMTQSYLWPSLGPGICPNRPGGLPLYLDSDLQFGLSADPVGSTYSLMGDGLFWLQEELMDPDRPADLSESFTFMDVDHPVVGDGATISYTLSYKNRGTVAATGVTVTVAALFGLQLVGSSPQSMTITLGDIEPGESGSVTFQGQVDLSATYTPCLALNPGAPELCEPFRDWAAVGAVVYDAAHGIGGNPLEWLWADHRVDSEPPESLGILWPESLIGSGLNTFTGYAYDDSGVPLVTLEVQTPSGATACPDDTPQDGVWTCEWDATAANGGIPPNDGDTFNLRLQATDKFGHSSQTDWRTFIVDTVPPTVTFSAETTATYSGTVVSGNTFAFNGQVNDNRGVDEVHACLNDDCAPAIVLLEGVPSGIYDDEPASPIEITGTTTCGGGEIVRTFVVTDDFTIGEIRLGFNADHTRRNDIQATLQSPLATQVQVIFPKEGSPYDAQNYDVLLYDAATSGLHDYTGDDNTAFPYYDREARPHQLLQAFRDEDSAGTWTLTICDTYPADYGGSYNHSRLVLKPQNTAAQTGDWFHTVSGLENLDDVEQTLSAFAVDLVGNQSTETISLTFRVDNVAPEVTVTVAVSLLETTPNRPSMTILSGMVSDGGWVSTMYALVLTPEGELRSQQIARGGDAWWFDLKPDATGSYTIWINAIDEAGNTTTMGPFYVEVTCIAANLSTAIVSAQTAVGASSPISVTARVSNNGGAQVAAGLPVAFYLDGAFIGTAATSGTLNAGESEDFTIAWDAEATGDYELNVVGNDDGTGARPMALCSAPEETHQTITILDVPLVKSWNLMSAYVNPFNTAASVVQLPIHGQYVVIQGFDGGAQSYYPDLPPAVNTLKDMDAEHGYWVKAVGQLSVISDQSADTAAEEVVATLRVVGEKFAEDRAIELDADWNLVSFLPRQPLGVTQALQSIDGQYTAVLGYNQGALSYYPDIDPSFNTLHEMEPLFGYWIRMAQAGTLQYLTTGGGQILDIGYSRSPTANTQYPIPNIRQAERAAGVAATHTWANFYGTAHASDGTPLPVGATVLALDPDGVVCGAAVVTTEGQYGLLACYGDDPTTPEDEGARPGDTIQLVVDGQVLATGTWAAHGARQWRSLGTVDLWQVYLPIIFKGYAPGIESPAPTVIPMATNTPTPTDTPTATPPATSAPTPTDTPTATSTLITPTGTTTVTPTGTPVE